MTKLRDGISFARTVQLVLAISTLPASRTVALATILAACAASRCASDRLVAAPSADSVSGDPFDVHTPRLNESGGVQPGQENSPEIIAVVNGVPVARSRVVGLLLRGHGAGLLEQIIGLELAGELAARRGVSTTESDVAAEYDLALRRLSDPLAMVTPDDLNREAAERVLDAVLAERNISPEEFFITIRRNTYLRRVVELDLTISEEELRAEYRRLYGRRAEVRHIQLGSDGDVRRVEERLDAGDDFAALAVRYSANVASARRGGLLEAFSRNDPAVPEPFRRVAFSLSAGEVSDVVEIGEWRHLIRLERFHPADTRGPNLIRHEFEPQLRRRKAEQAMRALFDRLMEEATIEIRDPIVREAFWQRRGARP